ncbi:hypothetical protein AVEN_165496-1, partial [Araneus ventricosus]
MFASKGACTLANCSSAAQRNYYHVEITANHGKGANPHRTISQLPMEESVFGSALDLASVCKFDRADSKEDEGRSGLVVGSRPRDRRVAFRNPIPLKIRRVWGLLHAKSYGSVQTSSRWCGAEVWRGGCQLGCRPRHLTAVQNYEVRPCVASKRDVNLTSTLG